MPKLDGTGPEGKGPKQEEDWENAKRHHSKSCCRNSEEEWVSAANREAAKARESE